MRAEKAGEENQPATFIGNGNFVDNHLWALKVSCMINHGDSYEIRVQGLKNQQNYRGFSHACSAQYRDSARSNGAGLGGVVIWNGGFVDKSSVADFESVLYDNSQGFR